MKCKHFRRYLNNNPIDTVFDLEDEPAKFKFVYLHDKPGVSMKEGIMILEYDERMEN